jgi:hypothetical protein
VDPVWTPPPTMQIKKKKIPDLGTSWWCVVSSAFLPLFPRGKSPWYSLIGGWVGPTDGLERMEKWKFLPSQALELQLPFLGRPPLSQTISNQYVVTSSCFRFKCMCLRQMNLQSRCSPRYFTSSLWGSRTLFIWTGDTFLCLINDREKKAVSICNQRKRGTPFDTYSGERCYVIVNNLSAFTIRNGK